jgi:hypothetical protein
MVLLGLRRADGLLAVAVELQAKILDIKAPVELAVVAEEL